MEGANAEEVGSCGCRSGHRWVDVGLSHAIRPAPGAGQANGVTATKAKAIAEFKTVAVLVSVPNKLEWNQVLELFGSRQRRDDKCANPSDQRLEFQ